VPQAELHGQIHWHQKWQTVSCFMPLFEVFHFI